MNQRAPASSPITPTHTIEPNPLALSYQPRRLRGAVLSVAWNLAWLALFLRAGLADPQSPWLHPAIVQPPGWPLYIIVFYFLYAMINFPIDLWYGYLHERQFGLVKQGLRAWGRDWAIGAAQHGLMFVIGSCLIILLQIHTGHAWLFYAAAAILALFLTSTFFAFDLIPAGLFQFEPADEPLVARLQRLIHPLAIPLPRIVIFSHAELRDFSGGLAGLGPRQTLLISRPTIELASNALLRFVLLHEMGHRRFHHLLLGSLLGCAFVTTGLIVGDLLISRFAPGSLASPMYIPRLAMVITCSMIAFHPLLAYLGHRLEYQADRFYLRHGGTPEEMKLALEELSRRNLARTDLTRRHQSIVQAMPTPARRLHAAERYFTQLHH